jgi:hypothetical protein
MDQPPWKETTKNNGSKLVVQQAFAEKEKMLMGSQRQS